MQNILYYAFDAYTSLSVFFLSKYMLKYSNEILLVIIT